jgi:leader peptidase (prepilin peptidase) / N-methyltransferase
MKRNQLIAAACGICICGGLFITLVFQGKAIVPRGQPPFILLLCELIISLAGLLIAAVSDAKSREIPNAAPLLLLIAGVLKLALVPTVPTVISALLGAFLGGFPLLILALFSNSIGGGDVKLAASSGFALGWLDSYLALLAGLVGFVLYGGMMCAGRKRKMPDGKENTAFPFAPLYAAGCVAILVLSCVIRHSLIL